MTPGTYNISCYQGGTFSLPLKYQNPDGTTVDLTGYTARMRVRRVSDNFLIADFTTSNERITIVGGTTANLNNIVLFMLASDTAMLLPGEHKYDLDITAADGITVYFLLAGLFTVVPEVSY